MQATLNDVTAMMQQHPELDTVENRIMLQQLQKANIRGGGDEDQVTISGHELSFTSKSGKVVKIRVQKTGAGGSLSPVQLRVERDGHNVDSGTLKTELPTLIHRLKVSNYNAVLLLDEKLLIRVRPDKLRDFVDLWVVNYGEVENVKAVVYDDQSDDGTNVLYRDADGKYISLPKATSFVEFLNLNEFKPTYNEIFDETSGLKRKWEAAESTGDEDTFLQTPEAQAAIQTRTKYVKHFQQRFREYLDPEPVPTSPLEVH